MLKYQAKRMKVHAKRGEDTGHRVSSFLRRLYPRKTAETVAADTGISQSTVATWVDRCASPNSAGFVALTLAYGPEFLAAITGARVPAWLDRAVRAERLARLEAQQGEIERELTELRG